MTRCEALAWCENIDVMWMAYGRAKVDKLDGSAVRHPGGLILFHNEDIKEFTLLLHPGEMLVDLCMCRHWAAFDGMEDLSYRT